MNTLLHLADHATRGDLRTFLERLVRVGEAEVRLVSRAQTLAVYGCTQTTQGLLDQTPVVLVMRGFSLREAPERPVDFTVQARALLDRLARMGIVSLDLELPESEVSAVWAGVLPPAGGWEPLGTIDAGSLARVAGEGIERVAQMMPDQPGEAVVRRVRAAVWGAEIAPALPAAAAFGAEALGFLGGEAVAQLSHSRTWIRVSTGRGHVLVRNSQSLLG